MNHYEEWLEREVYNVSMTEESEDTVFVTFDETTRDTQDSLESVESTPDILSNPTSPRPSRKSRGDSLADEGSDGNTKGLAISVDEFVSEDGDQEDLIDGRQFEDESTVMVDELDSVGMTESSN
jgi:hypothetical protein